MVDSDPSWKLLLSPPKCIVLFSTVASSWVGCHVAGLDVGGGKNLVGCISDTVSCRG